MEANLEYMFKKFGFYFPDAEYLTDPEGLLKYLVSWWFFVAGSAVHPCLRPDCCVLSVALCLVLPACWLHAVHRLPHDGGCMTVLQSTLPGAYLDLPDACFDLPAGFVPC